MDLAQLELPHNPAPACAPPTPVVVHVFGDNGFVWDALGAHPSVEACRAAPPPDSPLAAARQLREHSRLVGAMVGALAGYRQQDAVHGLPLQLTAEEVTLAAHKGARQRRPGHCPACTPD